MAGRDNSILMIHGAGALLMALTGAVTMFALLFSDAMTGTDGSFDPDTLVLLLPAGLGGALGGSLFARLFGRPGYKGAALAALGAILATMLGGMIGTSFALPGSKIYAGAIIVPLMIGLSPLVFVVWTGGMTATHLVLKRVREGAGPAP